MSVPAVEMLPNAPPSQAQSTAQQAPPPRVSPVSEQVSASEVSLATQVFPPTQLQVETDSAPVHVSAPPDVDEVSEPASQVQSVAAQLPPP